MITRSIIRILNSKSLKNNIGLGLFKYCNVAATGQIGLSHENNQGVSNRENFQAFDLMVESRRNQAQRTVMIEIEKTEDPYRIYVYCSDFGSILNIYEYITDSKKVLVEFKEEESLKDMLRSRLRSCEQTPVSFPFFKLPLQSKRDLPNRTNISDVEIPIVQASQKNFSEGINQDLKQNCENISDQMVLLYERLKMNELGWRLRFLACRKVEWLLPAFLSHGRVLPFGSSVNTFGSNNSDVDMTLCFENPEIVANNEESTMSSTSGTSRDIIKRNLEIFASLMFNYRLGFTKIMKILNANVPIIKCHENFTELECDITIHNLSGYYMSELLYLYGCSDCRVRPLIYSIRWWAIQKKITQTTSPSAKITNFTLTLMILFFLMNTQPKVVPPIRLLNKLSGKSFCVEGITYSYVRDITLVPTSVNTQSLEELFKDFLQFYAGFDFRKNGLSLISGKTISSISRTPLFVQNPIEPSLNVSKNLNYEAIEIFKEECRFSLEKLNKILESRAEYENLGGLLAFANAQSPQIYKPAKTFSTFDVRSIMSGYENGKSPSIIEAEQYARGLISKKSLKKSARKGILK